MSSNELQKKIIAAAKSLPVNAQVPYAFEKRVMACLADQSPLDPWTVWSRLLWRAAAPCVAIMLAISAYTILSGQMGTSRSTLAVELEQTVWGPLISMNESW